MVNPKHRPAFPVNIPLAEGGMAFDMGMTVHAYFAGQALANMATCHQGEAFDPVGTAKAALDFADAMVLEITKRNSH